MQLITLPLRPKVIDRSENSAVFEIENLYPGYGITLGNALRRVLLSSLPGAAITQVKIKNANHEFSTIPHVMEDVVEIILNLKKIRFKLHGDEPQRATLKVSGEKEVYAKNFEAPSQLEVVSKDAYIATLTDKSADFEIEVLVERGLGYVPSEQAQKEKLPIGTVAIDAIFTPIRKVNYEVENMRVGDRIDYNRLRLNIETDGSLTPDEAFLEAVNILVGQFTELSKFGQPEVSESPEVESEAVVPDMSPVEELIEKEESDLDRIKISNRTKNALLRSNIKTVESLSKMSEDELKNVRGLGENGVKEIKKELDKLGLSFKA